MLLKLLGLLSFLGSLSFGFLAVLNGFSLPLIALSINCLVGFAVLIALGDIVDYLQTIATNLVQKGGSSNEATKRWSDAPVASEADRAAKKKRIDAAFYEMKK